MNGKEKRFVTFTVPAAHLTTFNSKKRKKRFYSLAVKYLQKIVRMENKNAPVGAFFGCLFAGKGNIFISVSSLLPWRGWREVQPLISLLR